LRIENLKSSASQANKKGGPLRPPISFFLDLLKPVQEPGIHSHIILVGKAVKAEDHPIELDGAENQPVFSEVQTTTEHHGHTTVANATSSYDDRSRATGRAHVQADASNER
jgi:hypothetical protein